jgi:putative hydrolase of the HAD superfamily
MRTDPPFQALIFDAGGVFVPHDNEVLFARLAARCTAPDAAERIRARHDRDATIGTGETSIAAVHRRLQDELGYTAGWDDFLDDWSCHLGVDPKMLALMTALAAGNRVLVFSNTNAEHWARVAGMCGAALAPFELYLSHEIGAVKPDLVAFARVAEHAGLEPGRCLFVDDMAENVEAARRAGFQAEQFTGQAALESLLETRGVRWARQSEETFA